MANMTFRQLTAAGDWTFGAGLGNYASAQQAIALNIQTSVLMWAGDCFFSLSGGNGLPPWVNWKGLFSVGTQAQLNAALVDVIAACYGVASVVSASVVVNATTRFASANYTVNTVYSQQVTSQVAILSGNVGS